MTLSTKRRLVKKLKKKRFKLTKFVTNCIYYLNFEKNIKCYKNLFE